MVYKNSAGATVVTVAMDSTDNTATVTCADGSAAAVSADCLGTAECTTGTCAP